MHSTNGVVLACVAALAATAKAEPTRTVCILPPYTAEIAFNIWFA
jgi:hypothetical protein